MVKELAPVAQGMHKSERRRHQFERDGFLMTQHDDVSLMDHDEPTTCEEVITSLDTKKQLEAMRSEIEFMFVNQV